MASKIKSRIIRKSLKSAKERKIFRQNGLSSSASTLNIYGYAITYDCLNPSDQPSMLDDDEDIYDEALTRFEVGEYQKSIDIFETLYRKYPHVGRLLNNLGVCYQSLGKKDLANELVARNYLDNPSYLFAKTSYARLCLNANRLDEIYGIFNGKYDLKALYPHREVFHIKELTALHQVLGLYFARMGKTETALFYLRSLEQMDSDVGAIGKLRLLLIPTLLRKFIKGRSQEINMQRVMTEIGEGNQVPDLGRRE